MARRRGQLIDGILLLDKPAGLSSNHALQRARRALDARKAGHTGTLDPFATGLLVCCLGRATRLAAGLFEADKTYLATLQLGVETDTGDLDGTPVKQMEAVPAFDAAAIEAVLAAYRGEIEQVPPMYSALKRDGKPLYAYAREGVVLEREPRRVRIDVLRLLEIGDTQVQLLVSCSKGTYVRTLAQDIGRALGCFAHLSALRRTRVGPFDVADAVTLDGLQAMERPLDAVIAIEDLPAGVLPAGV
ncbi:MAG: tRNA pseudouridine(55) synthase TruB [Castellaniella sp.]